MLHALHAMPRTTVIPLSHSEAGLRYIATNRAALEMLANDQEISRFSGLL